MYNLKKEKFYIYHIFKIIDYIYFYVLKYKVLILYPFPFKDENTERLSYIFLDNHFPPFNCFLITKELNYFNLVALY